MSDFEKLIDFIGRYPGVKVAVAAKNRDGLKGIELRAERQGQVGTCFLLTDRFYEGGGLAFALRKIESEINLA